MPVIIRLNMNGSGFTSSDEQDDLKDAVQAAADTWSQVSASFWSFSNLSTTRESPGDLDGKITLFWDTGNSVIKADDNKTRGSTFFTFNAETGEILDADVAMNVNYKWFTSKPKTVLYPPKCFRRGWLCAANVQTVVLHELGHTLGLAHSGGAMKQGRKVNRKLKKDDKRGVTFLYPENHYPEVSTFYAAPSIVLPGGETVVTISATDPEGDAIKYKPWKKSGGRWGRHKSLAINQRKWKAPKKPGTYSISVGVSDKQKNHIKLRYSLNVQVGSPPPSTTTTTTITTTTTTTSTTSTTVAPPVVLQGTWNVLYVPSADPTCTPAACSEYPGTWVLGRSEDAVVGTFVSHSCIDPDSVGVLSGEITGDTIELRSEETAGPDPGFWVDHVGVISPGGTQMSGTYVSTRGHCGTWTALRSLCDPYADAIVSSTSVPQDIPASNVLGAPDKIPTNFDNDGPSPGFVVVAFTNNTVVDGPGPDLAVHIRDFHINEPEEAFELLVSEDGSAFISLGITSPTSSDGLPQKIDFDLTGTGVTRVTQVKVVNNTVRYGYIYEGPDIDAFEALNSACVKGCPSDAVFCDDFNDGSLDTNFWIPYRIPQSNTGTIVETSNELEITAGAYTGGSQHEIGIQSRCKLRGDFDLYADYKFIQWAAGDIIDFCII